MYPAGFSYQRATSVQDAIARLAKEPDAKLLAGGHSLLPTMKLRLASPSTLVDLGGLQELRGIRRDGDTIAIGALTTHREIEFSKELKAACPLLPEAAAQIGDPLGPQPRHHRRQRGACRSGRRLPRRPARAWRDDSGGRTERPPHDCRRRLLPGPVHDGASAGRTADGHPRAGARSRLAPAWPTRSSRIRRRATRSWAWRPWSASRMACAARRAWRSPAPRRTPSVCRRWKRRSSASRWTSATLAAACQHVIAPDDLLSDSVRVERVSRASRGRAVAPRAHSRRRSGASSTAITVTAHCPLTSIGETMEALEAHGYIAERELATSVFLARRLQRPLLLEGEAGVGKTELARVLASVLDAPLIRLQCYEGLDVAQALYDWDYARQMLRDPAAGSRRRARHAARPPRDLRPGLPDSPPAAAGDRSPATPSRTARVPVLLIDEIDRADEEFEAFLLELLGDWQVTIPEVGTIRAKHPPVVIITSNRTREIHDALKRRCLYHWIRLPRPSTRSCASSRRKAPAATEQLSRQIVAFVQALRGLDLYKPPGVAETLDWAAALLALDTKELGDEHLADTLGALVKYQDDVGAGADASRRATHTRPAGGRRDVRRDPLTICLIMHTRSNARWPRAWWHSGARCARRDLASPPDR